jgi:hypothetical protein
MHCKRMFLKLCLDVIYCMEKDFFLHSMVPVVVYKKSTQKALVSKTLLETQSSPISDNTDAI